MAAHRDREALAEEWHQLLCSLDPSYPEQASLPIAGQVDAFTLAYAILLVKEGAFNLPEAERGRVSCNRYRKSLIITSRPSTPIHHGPHGGR